MSGENALWCTRVVSREREDGTDDSLPSSRRGRPTHLGGLSAFSGGGREAAVVTREYMGESALRAYRRWGTLTAWAMLRALGVSEAYPAGYLWAVVPSERYGDLAECMANRETPMDGRRL